MITIIGNSSLRRDLLLKFRCLSVCGKVGRNARPGHEDGWGIVSYKNGLPEYVGKSIEPAWRDRKYELATENIAGEDRIILGHLRKASFGSVSLENTQPLVSAKWSFAHNGTIYSPTFTTDNHQSDSRTLFGRLVEAIEARESSVSVQSAITDGMERIREEIRSNPDERDRTYSSLTFVLSDGDSVYVMRDFESDQDRDYYTMFYRESAGAVIFCQEEIWDWQWKSLGNKQLATVNRAGTLKLEG
jgi:predicted glutamine amidotransferase